MIPVTQPDGAIVCVGKSRNTGRNSKRGMGKSASFRVLFNEILLATTTTRPELMEFRPKIQQGSLIRQLFSRDQLTERRGNFITANDDIQASAARN